MAARAPIERSALRQGGADAGVAHRRSSRNARRTPSRRARREGAAARRLALGAATRRSADWRRGSAAETCCSRFARN